MIDAWIMPGSTSDGRTNKLSCGGRLRDSDLPRKPTRRPPSASASCSAAFRSGLKTMPLLGVAFLLRLPEIHLPVMRGDRQCGSVRRKGQVTDEAHVLGEAMTYDAGLRIPADHSALALAATFVNSPTCDDRTAVGRHIDANHRADGVGICRNPLDLETIASLPGF